MLEFSDAGRETTLKVGVYGASGEGKTWLGCTAPQPLILLFEPQGFATVRLYAKTHGIAVPPTVLVENAHDFDVVVRTLAKEKERPIPRLYVELNKARDSASPLRLSDEQMKRAIQSLPYERPSWLVIDSITELAWQIEKRIEDEAPPRIGTDGLPVKTMRHSTSLRDRFVLAVKRIRDLHYNVLMLALRDDREVGEEDAKRVIVSPSLPMRKMPQDMISTLNALGLLRRERVAKVGEDGESEESEVQRVVRFAPLPSYIVGKPYGDLGIEAPNVASWIDKLSAAVSVDDDGDAQEAPTDTSTDTSTDSKRTKRKKQE